MQVPPSVMFDPPVHPAEINAVNEFEPAPDNVPDTVPEAVAEPVPEAVLEPVHEAVAEPVLEPVADPATEPVYRNNTLCFKEKLQKYSENIINKIDVLDNQIKVIDCITNQLNEAGLGHSEAIEEFKLQKDKYTDLLISIEMSLTNMSNQVKNFKL